MMDNRGREFDLAEREFDRLERQFELAEREFNATERCFELPEHREDQNQDNMKYWDQSCIRIFGPQSTSSKIPHRKLIGRQWSSEKILGAHNSVERTKVLEGYTDVGKISNCQEEPINIVKEYKKNKFITTESSIDKNSHKHDKSITSAPDKTFQKDETPALDKDQHLLKVPNELEKTHYIRATNRRLTQLKSAPENQKISIQRFSTVSWEEASDTIVINVAGEVFETYIATLNRYPTTLLGNPKARQKFLNKEGELFFDRSSDAFEAILYYYQSDGDMYYPSYLPLDRFIQELVFFKLGDEVIHQLELEEGLIEAPAMDLPKAYLLQVIWKILEYPASSRAARVFAISSVSVIFLSTVLFIIESIPEFSQPVIVYTNRTKYEMTMNVTYEHITVLENKNTSWLFTANTAIIVWFTSELLLRFVACPDKIRFWTNFANLIDLFSVLPYYIEQARGRVIGFVRVFRVLRILKLSRHSSGMQLVARTILATYSDLLMTAGLLTVLVLIFSSLVYYAEYRIPGTKFKSIPHAAWWAIVTLTTVGYGDMGPATAFGRLVGSLTLLSGTLVLSLPLPSVVSNFTFFLNIERLKKQMQEAKEKQAQNEKNKETSSVEEKLKEKKKE